MPSAQSARRRLATLASIRAGHQTREAVEPVAGGAYFFLQIRDFNPDRTELTTGEMVRIDAGSIRDDLLLQAGDVLFLAKGVRTFSYPLGELPGPTLAASYFFVLRPGQEAVPAYLAWFLNLDSTRRHLARHSGFGANVPVVRRDVLEELEVPLPDLATQHKIVALAALMARQQELQAELAEKQRLLYTAACVQAANQSLPQ